MEILGVSGSLLRGNQHAANFAARGLLIGSGAGGAASMFGLLNPWVPAGVAGTMGSANLMARGLTDKNVVKAVSENNRVSPQALAAQFRALSAQGLLAEQPKE
jgi:hypothetical protein